MLEQLQADRDLFRILDNFRLDASELEEALNEGRSGEVFLGFDFLIDTFPNYEELLADFNQWYATNEVVPKWSNYYEKKHAGRGSAAPWMAIALFCNLRTRTFIDEYPKKKAEQAFLLAKSYCIDAHLQRLTTLDSENLTKFVIAFIQYLGDQDYVVALEIINNSIPPSVDGSAALIFWTIAPYLYLELSKELTSRKAVDLVLWWGRSREPRDDFDAKYPGLHDLDARNAWHLSKDENGASHTLSKKVGQHISANLISLLKIQKN